MRLLEQSAAWTPVDRTIPPEQWRPLHEAQQAALAGVALHAGGAILELAAHKRLDSLPRLQTRALQIRADLRRHVEMGQLPVSYEYAGGFDSLVMQLFDDCCKMWLPRQFTSYWRFGREAEMAALYVRFLTEFGQHLRSLPPDPRPDAEDRAY
jgi:hypothetical protein